ncbi:MAG: hypothetical protein OEM25_02290 [Gammaproteobacteria bacterium]|nr:hypothetical protein [Gammaproteobacteria bacterium]
MTKITNITLGTVLFFATSFALACDYPDRPQIPDGATASKDDLLAAKAGVQSYIAAVDEYLTCIESEEQAAAATLENPSTEELQRRDAMLSKKFDAANEEKALVGEQFNQQIRAYNKKIKENSE